MEWIVIVFPKSKCSHTGFFEIRNLFYDITKTALKDLLKLGSSFVDVDSVSGEGKTNMGHTKRTEHLYWQILYLRIKHTHVTIITISYSGLFYSKAVLKVFAKFIRKHLMVPFLKKKIPLVGKGGVI